MSPTHYSPTSDPQPKGTKRKRKVADAQSANSSTSRLSSVLIEAVPVEVDSDEGQMTRMEEVIVSKPPRKKRRVTSDAETAPARTPLTHQVGKKSHDVRNGGGRPQTLVTVNDEEDGEVTDGAVAKEHLHGYDEGEERMVENALSDGYHSNGMNDTRNDDFEVDPQSGNFDDEKQQAKDKWRGKGIHLRQEEEEESDEVEIVEAPVQLHQPTHPDAPSIVHVRPSKRPVPRMMPQSVPNWASPSSNTHRRQAVAAAGAATLESKALNKTRPAATSKKSKDSSFVALSSNYRNPRQSKPLFEPGSDSDRSPLLEWQRKPQQPQHATKPLRNEGPDVISLHDSDDSDSKVNLSPRARQRLAIFDVEVMGKTTRVVEKNRVKELNGRGEASTSKRSSASENSRPVTSTVRPTLHFGTQSYLVDIVPETEVENSQEDQLRSPSIAVRNHNRNTVADDSSTAGPSITKSLRPLPHISPSTFHPHLQPPNSSLPDTIIEPSSSLERQAEIEAIEQFESPEKEHTHFAKKVVVLNKSGVVSEARREASLEPTTNKRESAEKVWESESVRCGQEIAKQVEARRIRASASSGSSRGLTPPKKKSVQEVVARAQSRNPGESDASQFDENDDDEQQPEEEGVANASTSVVPPASGPPAFSQDQPPPVDDMSQSMEHDLIDLNGHMDVGEPEEVDKTHDDVDGTSVGINPELLRQEEEESTQDIMAEPRQRQGHAEGMREIGPNEGQDLCPPPVHPPASRLASTNGNIIGPNTLVSAEVSHYFCFRTHYLIDVGTKACQSLIIISFASKRQSR
jgi:hypothetical protein